MCDGYDGYNKLKKAIRITCWSHIYSLVKTAKANGINTYHYLWHLLEKLPVTDLSDEALERYLPWNPEIKADLTAFSKKLTEV